MKHWLLLVFPAVFVFLGVFLVIRSPPEPEILPTVASQATHTPVPVPTWTATSEPSSTATLISTATATAAPTHTSTPDPCNTVDPITNRNANLRTGPGIDYEIAGGITACSSVQCIGRNHEGDWIQLANGSWIAAFLLDNVKADSLPITFEPTPTSVPATATLVSTPTVTPTVDINEISYGDTKMYECYIAGHRWTSSKGICYYQDNSTPRPTLSSKMLSEEIRCTFTGGHWRQHKDLRNLEIYYDCLNDPGPATLSKHEHKQMRRRRECRDEDKNWIVESSSNPNSLSTGCYTDVELDKHRISLFTPTPTPLPTLTTDEIILKACLLESSCWKEKYWALAQIDCVLGMRGKVRAEGGSLLTSMILTTEAMENRVVVVGRYVFETDKDPISIDYQCEWDPSSGMVSTAYWGTNKE